MGKYFRVEIKFASMRQGILHDAFQFIQISVFVLNEENNIVKVGLEAAIYLTERDTIRIGHVDI